MKNLISALFLTSALVCYTPAHAQIVSITPAQGAKGDAGTNGTAGANGNTILSGVGAPSGGTGVNGDYYLNTANDMLYGPKTGAGWGTPVPLIGQTGATGPAGPSSIGAPVARTVSAATALQANDPSKAAHININLTSTAAISLSGGTTNTATVYEGPTTGVATGTGTGTMSVCNYSNSNTGTLTIGLNLSTVAASTCSFMLPIGHYFALVVNAGTVTASNGRDQSLG